MQELVKCYKYIQFLLDIFSDLLAFHRETPLKNQKNTSLSASKKSPAEHLLWVPLEKISKICQNLE